MCCVHINLPFPSFFIILSSFKFDICIYRSCVYLDSCEDLTVGAFYFYFYFFYNFVVLFSWGLVI